jgi:undecaprenyl-diphosphatase
MSEAITFVYLGIIEGLTEFIPVSSSGHLILARHFFDLSTGNDLAVDAVLQLAAAAALLVYFRADVLALIKTALSYLTRRATTPENKRLLWAIVLGTIPALVLGVLLEKTMETVFRSPTLVAYTLIAGSVLFVAAEWVLKKYGARHDVSTMTWGQGVGIGLFQALALVPGMSRSGMTIAGGMLLGFGRGDAARFGFLLSLPILFGSGLKKVYELDGAGLLGTLGVPLIAGSLAAFITGLLAIHILMTLVRTTSLNVFALYRIALAIAVLILI